MRADAQGLVVEFNPHFSEVYGWGASLIGQSIGKILPEQFRELHHSGFARFQLTETSKVVNHPLTLATICNDGTVVTRFQNTFPAQSQQGALADAKRAKRLSSRRRESHCSWNLGLA